MTQVSTDSVAQESVSEEEVVEETGQDLAEEETGGADEETLVYAREQGWVPRQEWHGDPREWTDAKSFADRSRGINALLRKANAEQRKRYEAELKHLREDVDNFKKGALENLQRQLDAREVELQAMRAQAVSEGNGAEFSRIERDLKKIADDRKELESKRTAEPDKAPPDPEQLRIAKEWVDARPWLQTDKKRARLVQLVGGEIQAERPELVGDAQSFLTEVDRRLKTDYPELFGNGSAMKNPRVDSSAPARSVSKPRTKAKGYDDLPQEAKETCDRMVRQKLIKSRDDYVKYFDWSAT
jgi:hypothetical protein